MLTRREALEHLRSASEVARLPVDDVVLPADHDVVVDGMRLHYLDWGAPGRPAIVFLHGGGLTAHTWDLVCLGLRGDYRCIALDQRGHGDSEWSPNLDYTTEAHVRDIRGIVGALGLAKPVFVGHSLGGLNAMTYAASAADGLGGIVLVDVGPGVEWSGVQRIKDFLRSEPTAPSVDDFVERARAFNPRRDPALLRTSLMHNLRRLPDGSLTWKYDRRRLTDEYFVATKNQLDRLSDLAPSVTCPVLIVRGAESEALGPEAAARFAAAFPQADWTTVESAGHTIQGDNPLGLVRVIRDFLA